MVILHVFQLHMLGSLRGCLENLLGNHMTLIYTSFKQIHEYIYIYNIQYILYNIQYNII